MNDASRIRDFIPAKGRIVHMALIKGMGTSLC